MLRAEDATYYEQLAVVANFFLGINAPHAPTKFFTYRSEAMSWLLGDTAHLHCFRCSPNSSAVSSTKATYMSARMDVGFSMASATNRRNPAAAPPSHTR